MQSSAFYHLGFLSARHVEIQIGHWNSSTVNSNNSNAKLISDVKKQESEKQQTARAWPQDKQIQTPLTVTRVKTKLTANDFCWKFILYQTPYLSIALLADDLQVTSIRFQMDILYSISDHYVKQTENDTQLFIKNFICLTHWR